MRPVNEYRSRRTQGWVLLMLAAPLLLVGFGLIPDGNSGGACCIGSFGGLIAWAGWVTLRTRVSVGPAGVTKRPWLPDGFTVPWKAVEWWCVVDLRSEDGSDMFNLRAVRFAVGWKRLEVREAEVYSPGFEVFVADVRSWIGDREEPDGGSASPVPEF